MSVTVSPGHPYRSFAVLGSACVSYALAQTMLIPALPALITGLDTNENDIAWTLTAYFLAAAVATPVLGRLGDMFGKRRMMVVSMAAFTVGALVSALATDLSMMIAGRVLAGVGGGVFPLAFSMARDLFPPRQVARSIGFLAATISSGSAVGLLVGGALVDHFSWQWIFWASVAMGAVSTIGLRLSIPESSIRTGGRVDVRGAVVLGVGLTLPVLAISRAATWGWADIRTLGLTAAGLTILVGWVRLELHTRDPLANIGLLRSPPVLVTNVTSFLIGFAPQGLLVLVPLIAQAPTSTGYGFGLDATQAGLLQLPGTLLAAIAGPISGAVGTRVGSKVPLAVGGAMTALALVLAAFMHDTPVQLAVLAALALGGFGLAIAAIPNLIIDAVPPTMTGESVSFNAVVMRVSGSVGIQVALSMVAASAVAGSSLPTSQGFKVAFLIGGVVSAAGVAVALVIPHPSAAGRRAANAAVIVGPPT